MRSGEEAGAWLESLINVERRPDWPYARLGLAPIRRLLERLGEPQRELPLIHVAGSKGKGSTALFAEALLTACGERVGTFTSPHLARWPERVRVGGREVEGARLAASKQPSADSKGLADEFRKQLLDRRVELVLRGVADDSQRRHAALDQSHGDDVFGQALDEFAGAIHRIDDPHRLPLQPQVVVDGLLRQPTAVGADIEQGFFEIGVGGEVGGGQWVAAALVFDLIRAAKILQGQRPSRTGRGDGLFE